MDYLILTNEELLNESKLAEQAYDTAYEDYQTRRITSGELYPIQTHCMMIRKQLFNRGLND